MAYLMTHFWPAGTEARKLMLEDGLVQPHVPVPEPKGFGEFDMDM